MTQTTSAGWSSPVARQAHNLKVVSSNLTPATKSINQYKSLAGGNKLPHAIFQFTSTPRQHRDRILTFGSTRRHSPSSADTKAPLAVSAVVRTSGMRALHGVRASLNAATIAVSAGPSPMAYWLDYSATFHGMSSSTSLCICWSRILRRVAAK